MAFYLVTGGCGFIGSHLCDALITRGHTLRVLDDLSAGDRRNLSPRAELIEADVADAAAAQSCTAGVDGVFHLAAMTSTARVVADRPGAHRANVTGTLQVFEAAHRARPDSPLPVVYASSAAVYGDKQDLPFNDNAWARPTTAIGADKLSCELNARVAGLVRRVPTLGLRFFNVFGPRQRANDPDSGVIAVFCDRLRHDQPVTIFGDGLQQRDFVYVGDAVRALIAAMEAVSTDAPVYNVCTGIGTTILEAAQTLGPLLGRDPVLQFEPPRPREIRRSVGSPTAIRRALGWRARTTFAAGLVDTVFGAPLPVGALTE